MIRTLLLLAAIGASAFGELIPAANLVDWTPGTATGISGGIPTRPSVGKTTIDVTATPYFADNTGATDASAAIQSAIAAATSGDVVYLPPGTYRINTMLALGESRDGITLRGAGVTTILDSRVDVPLYVGHNDTMQIPFGASLADVTVSGGLTKGSQSLTVGSSVNFTVGKLMLIRVQNDPDLPMFSVDGSEYAQGQLVKITSKPNGTTINFSPPLYENYGGGARTVICYSLANGFQTENVGIEDLLIDGTNANSGAGAGRGIDCQNLINSWFKGVRIKGIVNYPLALQYGLNIEARRCYIEDLFGAGSNRAGMLVNATCASLFEDNIILNCQPQVEINQVSSGNAFAYNYCPTGPAFGWDFNHGSGPAYNLLENSWVSNVIGDGYFGTTVRNTIFRNNLLGTSSLKRMTYETAMIGNFLNTDIQFGYPNIGNTGSLGTANYPSDPWADYGMTGTLTTRTSASVGVVTLNKLGQLVNGHQGLYLRWNSGNSFRITQINNISGLEVTVGDWPGIPPGTDLPEQGTSFVVTTGAAGYQEIDEKVEATTIKKGNRYTDDNSFDPLSGDTLPKSLLYGDTKPAWMIAAQTEHGVTFNIDAFDPVTPITPTAEMIPAGYRFINGDGEPEPPSGGMKRTKVGGKNIRIGGKVLKIGDN